MRDKEGILELLDLLKEIYTPDSPEDKDGIGHDIEHVKGSIRRAGEIMDYIENNQEIYPVKFDRVIATTVEALHDIGNKISRTDHAILGAAVAKGTLTLQDIFDVPTHISDKGAFLSEEQKGNILRAAETNDVSGLTEQEANGFSRALTTIMRLDLGVNGINGNDFKGANMQDIRDYLLERYNGFDTEIADSAIDGLFNGGKLDDLAYAPYLKDITEMLNELFTPEEIRLIANAIQDHNIDHNEDMSRFEARNIYGMLAADADKDTIFEVNAIRTIAFAINHDPENTGWFKDENGNLTDRVVWVVYGQCFERGKEPHELASKEAFMQRIPDVVHLYKDNIHSIKGIIAGEAAVSKYLHDNPDASVKYLDGTPYCILQEYGDDVYSQFDAKYMPESRQDPLKGDILKTFRGDIIEKTQQAAYVAEHPQCVDDLPPDMQPEEIFKAYTEAESIEDAVDRYESEYYGDDNSFNTIIEGILDDEAWGGTDIDSEKTASDDIIIYDDGVCFSLNEDKDAGEEDAGESEDIGELFNGEIAFVMEEEETDDGNERIDSDDEYNDAPDTDNDEWEDYSDPVD